MSTAPKTEAVLSAQVRGRETFAAYMQTQSDPDIPSDFETTSFLFMLTDLLHFASMNYYDVPRLLAQAQLNVANERRAAGLSGDTTQ